MAPSPTGEYHVGHISTLLKNYAFAKKHGGQFVLRIEDTDQVRKVDGAVEKILSVIHQYGLDWDEGPDKGGPYGPYTQSERLPLYASMAQKLVQSGHAYYCTCSSERLAQVREKSIAEKIPPKYDRHCLKKQTEVLKAIADGQAFVIRLKSPDAVDITFIDLIRGTITINSESVDDQVLLKSDGFPTYHLAVVVDDHEMNITHIFRGEEWISSTPKHILLYEAFGWEKPVYAHIPVFLNPDGKGKMSKRKGTVSAVSFLESGYLPEALLNFFMILGWTPKDQREVITLNEYIAEFEPKDISPKSVVFDVKKLQWLNGVYIRNLSLDELAVRCEPFLPEYFGKDKLPVLLPLVAERLVTLADIVPLTEYFFVRPQPQTELLTKKSTNTIVIDQLQKTAELFKGVTWKADELEQQVRLMQEKWGWQPGQFFMMLRVAVTGKTATPPLFDTIAAVERSEVLTRLQEAIIAVSH